MNKIVKTGLAALLSIGILGSCASNKFAVKGYNFGKVSPDTKMEFVEDISDLENLLYCELKNIKASGVFAPEFMKKLGDIEFVIERGKDFEYAGGYEEGNSKIRIYLDNNQINMMKKEHKVTDKIFSMMILETLIHENLHYYWDKTFSKEKKKEFREKVKKEIRTWETFKTPHSLFNVRNSFYTNLEIFLNTKDKYKKHYGELFDEYFYGTEAFAYLMEREIFNKAFLKKDLESCEEFGYKEKVRNSISKDITQFSLPDSLKGFYKGCINNYFFQRESLN